MATIFARFSKFTKKPACVKEKALVGAFPVHCETSRWFIDSSTSQDVPSSEVLWYHVIFVAVMFLLIGLDLVVTRLCQ